MPTPQILEDIVRLLIQLLPAMALICLLLAGIALRLEGGSTFSIGGTFSKWVPLRGILALLAQRLPWVTFLCFPGPPRAAGTRTYLRASLRHDRCAFRSC